MPDTTFVVLERPVENEASEDTVAVMEVDKDTTPVLAALIAVERDASATCDVLRPLETDIDSVEALMETELIPLEIDVDSEVS